MDFIIHHISFLLSIGGLLFLPGLILLRLLFGKISPLSSWETLLTAFALSVGLLDFLMLLLGKNHILFTQHSIAFSILVCLVLLFALKKVLASGGIRSTEQSISSHQIFTFTAPQKKIFLFILFLTFLTKTIYLSPAAFPTSTDLGHHMYWSKQIALTASLPEYSEREITTDTNGEETLSKSIPIADFIIGEHLPFAAIAIFSKNDFLSAFPVNLLFLINMLSLFAYFALAIRLGEEIKKKIDSFVPQHFGLIVLFLLGPLYTLATPQAKFVSGGVVGNTFGNFFIPLILLFFFRGIREKNSFFLGISFFLTFTIAYTHHLSTLVLLFILASSIITLILLHLRSIKELLALWMKLLRHPFPLIIAFFCILFFFVVAMPTYIETNAIGTAIGTPTKLTRIGLTFQEILSGSGEARATLGIAGLLLIFFFSRRFKNASGILIGWTVILLIMSLKPNLVFLDIPSNRIGSYMLFPFTLLAGFAILLIPEFLRKEKERRNITLPLFVLAAFVIVISVYSIGSGSADNGGSLLSGQKSDEAVQTFAVSQFLAERIRPTDILLKDHNYLAADSFMKLFFMRDYGFPLSRGYFKRYETQGHEQCSLIMIASPNTPAGERCFATTGTNLVIVNPIFDRAQFEKSPNFSRVYSSPLIHVYSKQGAY